MPARRRVVGVLSLLLGAGIAAASVLGPLVTDVIRHRTSPTTLNQVVGGDLAGLVVVAPVALLAGLLVLRGHPAGPPLALAPAVWAVYMYAQLVVGQEHLDLPGNVERFFWLYLALFVAGEVVAVLAWRDVAADTASLPTVSRRLERTTGVVLLVIAAFLVVGLHAPTLPDALSDQPTAVQYTSSPTPFWLVKLMDLGIVVPAAVAIGVGLLRRAAWARTATFAILGGYTLLSAAVWGMAAVMLANDDPDATLANVVAFGIVTLALAGLTGSWLRPLLARPRVGADVDAEPPVPAGV